MPEKPMENGCKIVWTDNALSELKNTFDYLEKEWTHRELHNLAREIEKTIKLISNNPTLFPVYSKNKVHKAVIKKLNTIYYRKVNDTIEILSFFSNRQNPDKRKI